MSCAHTFSALFTRTAYSRDGAAVDDGRRAARQRAARGDAAAASRREETETSRIVLGGANDVGTAIAFTNSAAASHSAASLAFFSASASASTSALITSANNSYASMSHPNNMNAISNSNLNAINDNNNAGTSFSASGMSGISMPNQTEVRLPRDDTPHLSAIRPLLRPYGSYSIPHAAVACALRSLLGTHVLAAGAKPGDALAFAAAFAYVVAILDAAGILDDTLRTAAMPVDIDSVRTAAHFVRIQPALLARAARALRSHNSGAGEGDSIAHARAAVRLFVAPTRARSAVLTDVLWTVVTEVLPGARDAVATAAAARNAIGDTTDYHDSSAAGPFLALEPLFAFAEAASGIPLSDAGVLELIASGQAVHDGRRYDIAGFCGRGLILAYAGKAADVEPDAVPFRAFFVKVARMRPRSRADVCAACSATPVDPPPSFNALVTFENALISADFGSARGFHVRPDGMTMFIAQSLLLDPRRRSVVRTGLRTHSADVWALHALLGFNLRKCQALTFLFDDRGDRAENYPSEAPEASCNGVRVSDTVCRMDDFQLDRYGRVTAITLGSKTKFARKLRGRLGWADQGNDAVTLDDLVG